MPNPLSKTLIVKFDQRKASPTKSQTQKVSLFKAVSKLKHSQNLIIQEKHRNQFLNRHSDKDYKLLELRQQKDEYYSSIRNFALKQRLLKEETQKKKIKQVKKQYSINIKKKEEHRKMMDNIKKSFFEANHMTYEQIKKKKQQYDHSIVSSRYQQVRQKSAKRLKIIEGHDLRRKSIQNFYKSKIQNIKKQKETETDTLLNKSHYRRQIYENIVLKNSQIRQRSSKSQRASSTENPEIAPIVNKVL